MTLLKSLTNFKKFLSQTNFLITSLSATELRSIYCIIYQSNPAPRGAYRGRAPPNDCLCPPKRKLCPPKRGLCPEEINRSGLLDCKSRPKLVFFLEITCVRPEKLLEFAISGEKFLAISVKTFFFLRSPVSGRKILLNLCFSPSSLDPDWDKFLVPPCPSRIHTK